MITVSTLNDIHSDASLSIELMVYPGSWLNANDFDAVCGYCTLLSPLVVLANSHYFRRDERLVVFVSWAEEEGGRGGLLGLLAPQPERAARGSLPAQANTAGTLHERQ